MLTVAILIGLFVLTWKGCQEKFLRDTETKRARRQALSDKLDALVCPSCCKENCVAVHYDGWQGSIHTFGFFNERFANLFFEANRGKCLSD